MAVLSWQLTLISVAVVLPFVYFSHRIGHIRRRIQTRRPAGHGRHEREYPGDPLGVRRPALQGLPSPARRGGRLPRRQPPPRRAASPPADGRPHFLGLAQSFFSSPRAVAYLAAGFSLNSGRRRDHRRHARRLHRAAEPALLPLRPDPPGLGGDPGLDGPLRAHLRVPRPPPGPRGLAATRVKLVPGQRARAGRASRRRTSATRRPSPSVGRPRRPRRLDARDIDLEIQPGQLAALVGPSGAGKTTHHLPALPASTTPPSGRCCIDGHDVRDIRWRRWPSTSGWSPRRRTSSTPRCARTCSTRGPDATHEEVEAAARAAHIHERIVELPEGYDTLVGERGYRMSGGEKQRLSIARTILKDPRILILDEATSSLDTTSERLVQSALRPLMRGRTTIAIAHRLSTIIAADVIFVVDRGRVVERGTHAELVAGGRPLRLPAPAAVPGRPGRGALRRRPRAGQRRRAQWLRGGRVSCPRRRVRAHRAWTSTGCAS